MRTLSKCRQRWRLLEKIKIPIKALNTSAAILFQRSLLIKPKYHTDLASIIGTNFILDKIGEELLVWIYVKHTTEVVLDYESEIGELMEIILYVEDMNRQVSFYRDQLGFKVVNPQESKDYGKEFWVELNTGSCSLALHAGGKGRFGADAPKIVFRVKDILAARQQLLNLQVEMEEIRSAAPGVWVCDGADPEGNKFSIESHD